MIAHISDDGQHRTESVAEHTEKTVFLCNAKGARCGLSQVMSLCAAVHDMGKNKQAFQDYICADPNARQKLRGSVAHASTGAKYVYDRHHDSQNPIGIMTEMISYAVAAHHGVFDCVKDPVEMTDLFSNKLNNVGDYDEACRNAEKDYLKEYNPVRMFEAAAAEFRSVWGKIGGAFQKTAALIQMKDKAGGGNAENGKEKQNKEDGQTLAIRLTECKFFLLSCLQRLILSILIDSDWEATSDFMNQTDTLSKCGVSSAKEIFEKASVNFNEYMRRKREEISQRQLTEKEKEIFDARNFLQDECRRFAGHSAGIYCLPIPTGGGKTLSGLAYALEYCRLHPETERVIYVSPYISITEQNAEVFREAVGNPQWILEHHSSVTKTPDGNSEDYRSDGRSRFEMNWEEPFICTTFVQFMNTLFSDKSECIRRMHRLVHAVVIIDEVQSMPTKCIHTFNYMINFLNAVCNTDVILCTATQPALRETECPICYSEPKSMIENPENWFRKLERVKIVLPQKRQKHTIESLADEIIDRTAEHHSILIVLNTKSAVRNLYDCIKKHGIPVIYLTTNLCAEHRSDQINAIRDALTIKDEPIVVVSTNLIEAGVDISFECVYRSMTGLDSLAQTAGRCNRNGELECGEIYLIELEGENAGNMAELQQKMRVTRDVIDRYLDSRSSEKKDSLLLPEWMDEYYQEFYFYESEQMNFWISRINTNVMELLSTGFAPDEKKHIMNQAYQTAGREYRVIDDDSFGVIVPYKEGKKLIESLQEASDIKEIKGYIRQAQRYTVNVRTSRLKDFYGFLQPVSDKIPGLYMASLPGTYHEEYGIAPEWEPLIF